jgi:hypothetical protein
MRIPVYVVRDRRAFAALLGVTALSLAVAAGLAVMTGQWLSPALAVAVIVYLAVGRLGSLRERLRVDATGVALSDPDARRPGARRYVPWSVVRQLEADGDLLVVRLRPDAAMPMWLKVRATGPDQLPSELRERVPGLDGAGLQQAVHDLGVDVPVVVT